MDILGQILLVLMFITPLFTIPLAWRISNKNKITRILLGLILAIIFSGILYYFSLIIIFRDGMGS